jgi:glycosyltransferase involved in cell wall biosynthesis
MVSFVVPAYNAARTIGSCLESILRQNLDGGTTETIVVDNASTDSTPEIVRGYPVRLLTEGVPTAAAARNRGIETARGDWIALVDADCLLPVDWTAQALRVLQEEKAACAVGGPGRIPQGGLVARCLNGLHYGLGPRTSRRRVRSLATMNVLFRGEVLRQHRFDPALYMGEDPDLNLRLLQRGYSLIFDPACQVDHFHPTTFRGVLRKWFRYGLHYALPYGRRGRLFSDPGFLPRLLYLPALLLLAALTPPVPWCGFAAAGLVLAVPLVYGVLGCRAVRGTDLLVFPWLHAAKQWAQMAGMVAGVCVPALRARRPVSNAAAQGGVGR